MARINIEDDLFKDLPFVDLMLKLGSRRAALGALVEAFMLAQRHYLSTDNDRCIPMIEWKRERIAEEIIEVGLAEVREKGVYVRGSEKQFSWLLQRSEAGKVKKEKKPIEVDGRTATTNNGRSSESSGSNPLTLSPTLSQSLNSEEYTIVQDDETDYTHPLDLDADQINHVNDAIKYLDPKLQDHVKASVVYEDQNKIYFLNPEEFLKTDKRTVVAITKPVFDLEAIYAIYPKKEGKKIGMERLKKIIKTQEKYDEVMQATRNYASMRTGQDHKYTKGFKSFVSDWEDYLVVATPHKSNETGGTKEWAKKMMDESPYHNAGEVDG